jgi:hypothetical protein
MGGSSGLDTGIRVSIGAGIFAFVLSAITALFSRIPFGILILRALLLGLVFAVLAFALNLLLRRLLPELFESSSSSDSLLSESRSNDDQATGNVVNIVLPGGEDGAVEVEALDYHSDQSNQDSDSVRSSDSGFRAVSPIAAKDESFLQTGESSSADLAREVGQIRQGALESTNQAAATNGAARSGSIPRPRVSVDDLDVLPDLDSLSESFAEAVPGSYETLGNSSESDISYSSGSFSGGAASSKEGGDPVVIAKAVQTLLRRDQKGQ